MNPIDVLRTIKNVIEWALPFVPREELKAHLTDTARRLDDAIADMAQAAKFGA